MEAKAEQVQAYLKLLFWSYNDNFSPLTPRRSA